MSGERLWHVGQSPRHQGGPPIFSWRYAFASVVRNRHRTFSSVLGVSLAIMFIAGTFVAIDSSTRSTLDGLLADMPGDFSLWSYGQGVNASDVRSAALQVPGVQSVSLSRELSSSEWTIPGGIASTYLRTIGVDPESLPNFLRDAEVEGPLELQNGTVALSRNGAETLGVGIGDPVQLVWRQYGPFGNETRTAVNLTVAALLRLDTYTRPGDPNPYFESVALVHFRDVDWIVSQLEVPYPPPLQGEVWIDRDRFVDPYSLDLATRNLMRLERRLQSALQPFGVSVQNNIANMIGSMTMMMAAQRIIFLLLSVPVLLLGLHLGAVGVDLGHAARRRELAVLKTRGAGRGQVIALLLVEAVIGGLIAAALGLVGGLVLSRFLLGTMAFPATEANLVRYDVFALSADTILTVVLFGVLFMLAVSYRSAKRTASLPIVETLRFYAPGETRIEYKPTTDVVLVSLGVLTYGSIAWSRASPGSFLVFLIAVIFTVLFPFAPIFLIVGSVRLLTRSTGKVYEWVSRASKPFTGELYPIVSRNLARNPRRAAGVAVIIALGLAFGIFTFSFAESQEAYESRVLRASIGADASAFPVGDVSLFLANASAISDVQSVSPVLYLPASPSFCCASVVALDPDTFFATAQPESWYFVGDPAQARSVLSTNRSVLITESYRDIGFLEVGDPLTLIDNGRTVNVTVGGIVRALPPYSQYGFVGLSVIYGSFETFGPFLASPFSHESSTPGVLVDLEAGADWRAVKADLLAAGASSVTVYEESVQFLTTDPSRRGVIGFLTLEIAFLVLILTAGLGLILYAATIERDVEFAAIRARGSSGWQMVSILAGEAFSILIIGFAVGVSVGLVAAYLSIQLFAPVSTPLSVVPLAFEIPWEGFALLALAPAAMMATALLVGVRLLRMDVVRVLKLRGG